MGHCFGYQFRPSRICSCIRAYQRTNTAGMGLKAFFVYFLAWVRLRIVYLHAYLPHHILHNWKWISSFLTLMRVLCLQIRDLEAILWYTRVVKWHLIIKYIQYAYMLHYTVKTRGGYSDCVFLQLLQLDYLFPVDILPSRLFCLTPITHWKRLVKYPCLCSRTRCYVVLRYLSIWRCWRKMILWALEESS